MTAAIDAARAMHAVRTSATVTRMAHVHVLRWSGPGAFDLLDAVTTSRLFARENQILQTLLLDDHGAPFADALVCLEQDTWLMLAEGPTLPALLDHVERVRRARLPDAEVTLTDLLTDHVLWSVDGPYAWEVTAALLGPEVHGAPYLSFLELRGVTCLRAGKTGEFGYLLLVPRTLADETWARLWSVGAPLDLAEADLATLDQCALENWHFTIRALGAERPGPAELQLQWRLDRDKDFVGAAAVRAAPPARRLTCFTAPGAPSGGVVPGQPVLFDRRVIGAVLAAGFSTPRGDWVGWALLDVALAWPGITAFTLGDGTPITTRSPPVIDNRSLFVDPRKHSYRTRDAQAFPPLVPA